MTPRFPDAVLDDIAEVVNRLQGDGEVLDISEEATRLQTRHSDMPLSLEDLTDALLREATRKNVPMHFSKRS